MLLFWKEFKLLLFDKNYAMTLGFNTKFIDGLISFFIVLAIVIGLQTVGVVLMSAMLLAPAAAARQWTNCLSVLVFLAATFGMFTGDIVTMPRSHQVLINPRTSAPNNNTLESFDPVIKKAMAIPGNAACDKASPSKLCLRSTAKLPSIPHIAPRTAVPRVMVRRV